MTAAKERTLVSAAEVRSVDWVPDAERHGKLWYQPLFWFMGDFQAVTVGIGFVGPALGLNVLWTFVAGFAGTVVGTTFMAFHASQGPRMGLPQMIQSRAQFGYRGVVVPLVAVLFTYVAFNVIGQVTIAQGMHSAYGLSEGWVALVVTVLAGLLVFFGHDWLHRTFRIILYVTAPLFAIISIAVITGNDGPTVATSTHYGFNAVGFMVMLGIAVSFNATYAVYVSDYSRYLPRNTSSRRIIASVFCGASLSPIWLIALGAWLAVNLGATDPIGGLKTAGNNVIPYFGSVFGIIAVIALTAIQALNGYGASLTLLTGLDAFREFSRTRRARIVAIVIAALLWYIIGSVISGTAVSDINNMLTLMLYLIVPWTAVNLSDFFLVRRGHYAITDIFRIDGIYSIWGWRGLTAFFAGVIAEIPFMVLGSPFNYTGPAASALSGVDISWAVGLVIAGATYLILARSIDLDAEKAAIAASEAELQSIDDRASAAQAAE
jgi:nucleobase:cation symporter-1, NCS1 family